MGIVGRPKSIYPKNIRFEIRLTEEQSNTLKECSKILDTSKADIVVQGIQFVKRELEKKQK